MGLDDDIAAALPEPPPPAPAQRQAAIDAALRRFDEGPQASASAPSRRTAWHLPVMPRLSGSRLGTAVTAALVVLIAGPVAWISFRDSSEPYRRSVPPAVSQESAEMAQADTAPRVAPAEGAEADLPAPRESPEPTAQPSQAPEQKAVDKDEIQLADASALASAGLAAPPPPAPPPPPPPPVFPPPAAAMEEYRAAEPAPARETPLARLQAPKSVERDDRAAGRARAQPEDSGIIVTARKRQETILSVPITTSAIGNEIVVTSRKAAPVKRGDWNACTVDDPQRSLKGCRRMVDASAKGATGRAAARVADGLSRAWEGDEDGAIAAFDQAIAIKPGSSLAHINRGLAWRNKGQLDRALADLDRAVKYAPGSARAYYNRSLILRAKGDERRADADRDRAVSLDRRYAETADSP